MKACNRFAEFFEGENNRFSMYRLLQFLAYPPSTAVMIYIHTTEAMSLYLAAFVTNGVLGKAIDIKGRALNANTAKLKK